MDSSLNFADKAHENVVSWVSSTKEKPWAKKMSTWFQSKVDTIKNKDHERRPSLDARPDDDAGQSHLLPNGAKDL